jgi:DNA-directed RNA polymerase sigma subunit (sigma70/sigma32)
MVAVPWPVEQAAGTTVRSVRALRSAHPVLASLQSISEELAELRLQRDELIRAHPGTLREIAEAAGLSHETVRQIRLAPVQSERSKR